MNVIIYDRGFLPLSSYLLTTSLYPILPLQVLDGVFARPRARQARGKQRERGGTVNMRNMIRIAVLIVIYLQFISAQPYLYVAYHGSVLSLCLPLPLLLLLLPLT